MKVKKEIIILILIIAALSVYLFVQKKGKTYYSLPELVRIEEKDVSKLILTREGSSIELERRDDQWVILPEEFPADETIAEDMVENIGSIALTALASESGNYMIYDLDDEHKIEVEIFKDLESLRRIEVGKTASSYRHTFVKVDDDERVFHAQGNLKDIFERTVSELRDKVVMAFDDEIIEVILEKGENELTLVKTSIPVAVDLNQQQGEENNEVKEPEEPVSAWMTSENEPAKEKEIEEIINSMSNLRCDDFVEGKTKEDLTSPLYTVSLKGMKTYSVSLFEKDGNQYIAVSSESDYPFLLPEWKAKRIMKDLDTLREIKE